MERILCEKCNTSYNLTKATLKTARMAPTKTHKGIQRTYLRCEHCKHQTTAFYTDGDIRRLQSRQRVLRNDSTLTLTNEERLAEFRANGAEIQKQMRMLKAELEGVE